MRILQSCKTKSCCCQILPKLVDSFNDFRQEGTSDCQYDNVRIHDTLTVGLGQQTCSAQALNLTTVVSYRGDGRTEDKTQALRLCHASRNRRESCYIPDRITNSVMIEIDPVLEMGSMAVAGVMIL